MRELLDGGIDGCRVAVGCFRGLLTLHSQRADVVGECDDCVIVDVSIVVESDNGAESCARRRGALILEARRVGFLEELLQIEVGLFDEWLAVPITKFKGVMATSLEEMRCGV